MTLGDWRLDPGWRLAAYDPAVRPDQPGDRPTLAAELATDPTWATEYHENRPVATWYRVLPLDPKVTREIRTRGAIRDGRRTLGGDAVG